MTNAAPKKTLSAATTTALSPNRAATLLSNASNVDAGRAEQFLDRLAAAEFEVTKQIMPDGRLSKAVAMASVMFSNPGDYRLAGLVSAVEWLFGDAVRQTPGAQIDTSVDTRGKDAAVAFIVRFEKVSKADQAARLAQVEALLMSNLPAALAQGVALARRAVAAVCAARSAEAAVEEEIKRVVEVSKKATKYEERLAALRAELRNEVEARFAKVGFTDLDADAMLCITAAVRHKAIDEALSTSPLRSHQPIIKPVL